MTIEQPDQSASTVKVGQDANLNWSRQMTDNAFLKAGDNVKNYTDFWKSVYIRFYNPSTKQSKESYVNYLTSDCSTQTIKTDKLTTVFNTGNNLNGYTTIQGIYVGKFPGDETLYRSSLKSILKEQTLRLRSLKSVLKLMLCFG